MSTLNVVMFGLDRTGGVVVLMRYMDALQARGDRVGITTLGRPNDRRWLPVPNGIDVRFVGLRGRPYKAVVKLTPGHLGFPALEQRHLAKALPAVDLLIATHSLTASVVAASDSAGLYHAQHFEPLVMQYPRATALAEDSYRLPLYLTANCSWVADRITEAGGSVRGLVMPAIDHSTFTPAAREEPRDSFRVVTLAKRIPWKGLVDVVGGADQLALASSDPVVLVTYGPDQVRPRPRSALVEHHGLVSSDRLADLLQGADACVSGSWYESFPLPPLEAMACGTPVVCTRLGTEDYAVHESNCLIVPPRDQTAIASALHRIRDDAELRTELVANGLTTARRFTWAAAETAFASHVDAALDGSAP